MINSALWAKQLLTANDSPFDLSIGGQFGFEVYRNTVRKGCIDALQANYPTVARVAGGEWFRAVANLYVVGELPSQPCLMAYGESFPNFLQHFEPAQSMPYLYGLAKLDRCWTEAHVAADAPVMSADSLSELAEKPIELCVLRLHPATRWCVDAAHPTDTLWQRERLQKEQSSGDEPPTWAAEATLLTRPNSQVQWMSLSLGGAAFLQAFDSSRTCSLLLALGEAIEIEPSLNASNLLAQLVNAGALQK